MVFPIRIEIQAEQKEQAGALESMRELANPVLPLRLAISVGVRHRDAGDEEQRRLQQVPEGATLPGALGPLISHPAPAILAHHVRIAQAKPAADQEQQKKTTRGIEAAKAFRLVAPVGFGSGIAQSDHVNSLARELVSGEWRLVSRDWSNVPSPVTTHHFSRNCTNSATHIGRNAGLATFAGLAKLLKSVFSFGR